MKIQTNREKYINKWDVIEGIAVPIQKPSKDNEYYAWIDEKMIEAENREKEVCLNCTKAKCRGTRKCFEKERNKRNGQG